MSANGRETGPRQVGSRRQQHKPTTWSCESVNIQTYISGTAFTTSVQSRSSCESNDFRAKTLSSGSGSDKKPTKPPAETSPTIVADQGGWRQISVARCSDSNEDVVLGCRSTVDEWKLGGTAKATKRTKSGLGYKSPGSAKDNEYRNRFGEGDKMR